MRRKRLLAGLVLTACAAVLASGWLQWRPIQTLDRLVYDSRLRYQQAQVDDTIVIVDIDEKSLADQGRWPWSRSVMSVLIERLAGAKAVALDIVFAEKELEPNLELLERLQKDPSLSAVAPKLRAMAEALDPDEKLARSLERAPAVLGYYFTNDKKGRKSGSLPEPVMPASDLTAKGWSLSKWDGYGANLPGFVQRAPQSGFFNPKIDDDGILRELILLAEHEGKVYESLAVATLRMYAGTKGSPAPLVVSSEGLRVGRWAIPATDDMTVLVPFAGASARRFTYYSASDVLSGAIGPEKLRNKLVLVGTSTVGLTDLRATPVSAVYPGVEVQASLLAGILHGTIKTHPPGAGLVAAMFTALMGIVLTLTMPRVSATGVAAIAGLAGMTLLGFFGICYFGLGWVVSMGPAIILVLALSGVYAFVGYFFEGRSRTQIAQRFGEYVSPQVVKRMLDEPEKYSAKSENRELTLLFADIRGFTRNAETMQPEALHEYINRFLSSMTDVIHSYHGTVDKYMGDAVMAFWGAPLDDAYHADNAVACALAMQQEAARLNIAFRAEGLPELAIGVGINTGRVLVGEMGSKRRRTYTAIGDAVNLASRLEQLTKQFDAKVIVGESTRIAATGHRFKELGSVLVSGRMESAVIFEPVSVSANEVAAPEPEAFQEEAAFDAPLQSAKLKMPRSMQRVA
jgi:adenylate cyclase